MNTTINSAHEPMLFNDNSKSEYESSINYRIETLNKLQLDTEITKTHGFPDSFALMNNDYVAIQYKQKKLIQIYHLQSPN